jgi:outer membrane receptor protein involved in Fe transport
MKKLLSGSASAALLAAFAASSAQAQTPPKASSDQPTSVSEIVVTAQKREQRLQDVPIEVQTLPANLLKAAGVLDIKDMQILTPGLTVTSTSNETITTARIRGVGTVGDNPGLESSVGVVIDGVYRPRNGVSFGDLGEVDRIEVLEGPQGTTFGENTTAGVINVITKGPSFHFGADAEATFGNYGEKGGSFSVTGPITDKLAGRIYFADRQRDGFYSVDTGGGPRTDRTDQDQNYWTARGQLLWQPTDALSFRLIADYTKRDENCCVAVQTRTSQTGGIIAGPPPLGLGAGIAYPNADPFARQAYANRSTAQKIMDRGVSLQGDLDIPAWNAKLTSITAFREWDTKNGQDIDYTDADILYRTPNGDTEGFQTWSEELRLAGSTKHVDWLIGGYFVDEKLTVDTNYDFGSQYTPFISGILSQGASPIFANCLSGTFVGLPSPPYPAGAKAPLCNGPNYVTGAGVEDHYSQNKQSGSFFTNDTWHITDKLDLTAGLRYTIESKTLDTRYQNLNGNGATCAGALGNYAAGNWNNIPGLTGQALEQAFIAGVMCLPWTNPFYANLVTHQSKDENNLSGTAKLSYKWSPQVLTYASYARGFKDGGFNLDRITTGTGKPNGGQGVLPVSDTSFPAETVDSYEAGLKTTWLHGKLLLNLTLFDEEYQHFQLNSFLGTSFVVESIPKVSSKGVDGQFLWMPPVQGLTFQGGFTYADTRYDHFSASQLINPSDYLPIGSVGLSLLPGSRISFAPDWSVSTAMNYDRPLSDGLRLLFNVSAKYLSDYNTGSNLVPYKIQPAYTLVNTRVGLGSADNRWRVEFWVENLTNVDYRQVVFDAPLQGLSMPIGASKYSAAADTQTYDAFLGAPRTYGVTLRVKY